MHSRTVSGRQPPFSAEVDPPGLPSRMSLGPRTASISARAANSLKCSSPLCVSASQSDLGVSVLACFCTSLKSGTVPVFTSKALAQLLRGWSQHGPTLQADQLWHALFDTLGLVVESLLGVATRLCCFRS